MSLPERPIVKLQRYYECGLFDTDSRLLGQVYKILMHGSDDDARVFISSIVGSYQSFPGPGVVRLQRPILKKLLLSYGKIDPRLRTEGYEALKGGNIGRMKIVCNKIRRHVVGDYNVETLEDAKIRELLPALKRAALATSVDGGDNFDYIESKPKTDAAQVAVLSAHKALWETNRVLRDLYSFVLLMLVSGAKHNDLNYDALYYMFAVNENSEDLGL